MNKDNEIELILTKSIKYHNELLLEAYSKDRFTQLGTWWPRYTLTAGSTVESSIALHFIDMDKECYLP